MLQTESTLPLESFERFPRVSNGLRQMILRKHARLCVDEKTEQGQQKIHDGREIKFFALTNRSIPLV